MSQARFAALGVVVVMVALALAGFLGRSLARGAETVRAPRAFTVQLLPRNGSDMKGTARFVPRGKRSFYVVLAVQGGPGGGSIHLAHVHTGPCSREPTFANPRIKDPLRSVSSGVRSRTLVTHPLAQYRRGKHSVNVHEVSGDLRPIACGDLPRRF